MWVFLIFLISSVISKEGDECSKPRYRSSSGDLMSSFNKFKSDVQSFFKINFNKFERRRKVIAKAFYNFLDEAFRDDGSIPKSTSSFVNENKSEADIVPIEELVKLHGYEVESHTVVTTDGYVLVVHKILPPFHNDTITKSGIVLLNHGLLGSSEDWVLLGPDKSLPYLLVNARYDVWLTNARGNKYSREHTSKTISDDEFWDFSWHEMGQFDLSAVIDYIRDQNDKNLQLHVVGHSMGCTALLALLSIYPRYNRVIKTAIFLAPMAFMYEVRGPLRVLSEFYTQNTFITVKFLGVQDFVPLEYFPRKFVDKFCKGSKILCSNPLLLLANGGQEISNENLKNNIMSHVPAGGSMKTIVHYMQQIKSGQFQMFDMGKQKNLKKYGTFFPPSYRLNDVTLPVAVFSSSDDWLATIPDIQSLLTNLPNTVLNHVIKRNDFSHTDFVWGEDANLLLYYPILDVLKQTSLESKPK